MVFGLETLEKHAVALGLETAAGGGVTVWRGQALSGEHSGEEGGTGSVGRQTAGRGTVCRGPATGCGVTDVASTPLMVGQARRRLAVSTRAPFKQDPYTVEQHQAGYKQRKGKRRRPVHENTQRRKRPPMSTGCPGSRTRAPQDPRCPLTHFPLPPPYTIEWASHARCPRFSTPPSVTTAPTVAPAASATSVPSVIQ